MYKLLLCLRYLRTRYIALASIVSVMLGVATMIVVNSVMAGFSSEMRERIHGILADVIIETTSLEGTPDVEKHLSVIRRVAGKDIEAMTATVEVYGMLSFKYHGQWITQPITLVGIQPAEKAKVSPLRANLDSYNTIREKNPETGTMTIVRKKLRSNNEPPGWELTKEAMVRRVAWVERLQYQRQLALGKQRTGDRVPQTNSDEPPWKPPEVNEAENGFVPKTTDPKTAVPKTAVPKKRAKNIGRSEVDGKSDGPAGAPKNNSGRSSLFGKTSSPQWKSQTEGTIKKTGKTPARPVFYDEQPKFPSGDLSEDPRDDPRAIPRGLQQPTPFTDLDPTAPLEGRLYIGRGLISFPFEDPKTGHVKTVMMVQTGDDVKISTVNAGRPPKAVHFNATVVDVFKSGMSEYDSTLVFCNLEFLQKVRGMIDPAGPRSVTSIQLKLKDYNQAEEVVKRLKAAFPPGMYTVRTWEQKQGPLLAAVEVESAILNVLLFLIIAVAGFGILAIFFMIVVEKTKDIGILKSLGASSGGIMSIFLSYGLALGIVGSGVGVACGLLFVSEINTIEGWITWLTGRKVFDEKIYYFPEIPTLVNPMTVFWVAVGAMTIAVLASILPARRAARLHPVEALRYE